jgi:site-specific DNA recombinase
MVYETLTRATYMGIHKFNVYSWRKKEKKSANEIVEMTVPAILSRQEFDEVQELLRSRSPKVIAPQFVNGPTLLGGICFCADCGAAMTLRTSGKADKYRYYTCYRANSQGKTGCLGRTVPLAKLDAVVTDHLVNRLLTPDGMARLLSSLIDRRTERADERQERILKLKRQAAEADAKLNRLYLAIEDGVAERGDPSLQGRLKELRAVRDSALADIARAEARKRNARPQITAANVKMFTDATMRNLYEEGGGIRRHLLQTLIQRVDVGDQEIRISGSKIKLLKALGLAATPEGVNCPSEVRGFDMEWLPGQDSNLRPTG